MTPPGMLVAALHEGGLGERVAVAAGAAVLRLEMRRFPDEEVHLRVLQSVANASVWLVANLARPDSRLLPVLLLAATLRAQGARFVGLAAPYLPYLRQDTEFQPGDCVSAHHFCALLGAHFDTVITVDAHLHRIARLEQLFSVPATNLSAAALLARHVARELPQPLLVGPDSESAQWVEKAAQAIGCPWCVLQKARHGDREVSIHGEISPAERLRTPVLLDDLLSTGATVVAATRLLIARGFPAPWVAVTHALCVAGAEKRLHEAGVARLLSSDSVPHPSNAVGISQLLAEAMTSN